MQTTLPRRTKTIRARGQIYYHLFRAVRNSVVVHRRVADTALAIWREASRNVYRIADAVRAFRQEGVGIRRAQRCLVPARNAGSRRSEGCVDRNRQVANRRAYTVRVTNVEPVRPISTCCRGRAGDSTRPTRSIPV